MGDVVDIIKDGPAWKNRYIIKGSPAWRNRFPSTEKASRPSVTEVSDALVGFMWAIDVPGNHVRRFMYDMVTALIRAEVLPAGMPRPPKPKKRKKRKRKHG